MKKFGLGIALVLLGSGLPVTAGIISADMTETLDLPDFKPDGPRIEQALGVPFPSAGPQLTQANIISNPSDWSDHLDATFDSTTNILTLSANAFDSYQTIVFTLTNISFDSLQQVTGFASLSTGNAVTDGTGPFTLATSFTGNSVTVSYTNNNPGEYFLINTAADTFQLTLGPTTASPEPGTFAISAMGLAGLLALARLRMARR